MFFRLTSNATNRLRFYLVAIAFPFVLVNIADSQNITQVPRAADAPQPLAPAESKSRMQFPAEFKIELVASEPVVEEPSCIAFDEFGRTFVCELHGYNVEGEIDVAELNKSGTLDKNVRRIRWELKGGDIADQAADRQYGKVKLLIDENGDGVMDRAEVWADDLPACYGIVAARGGVIVTCAPDIVFLADSDGDGKVDVRKTLFTGFRKEVLERGINNPRWGLDNWIYIGSGGSGGSITGPHLKHRVELGNTDFRIRSDGSAIEPVNGCVGTFGMTINDMGDRFPASGGQPATYALPLPYRFLARNPHVPTPSSTHRAVDYNRGFRISAPHPWRVQRQKDPAWVKFYGARETNSNYFSGGCSNEFYGDSLFPEIYRGSLFYCEPSLNMVHRCVVTRDGAKYTGERSHSEKEFLASTDQWFRPMNLRVGPDGALYIVDMYREIIEDYSAIPRFLQQQYGLDKGRDHGRIWRLSPKGSLKASFVDWSQLSTARLVDEMQAAGSWRRKTAQRLLIERNVIAAVPELEGLLQTKPPSATLLGALYTLEALNKLTPRHLGVALKHNDYRVRTHAIRLSHRWLDGHRICFDAVGSCADDPSPVVRLETSMALGAAKHKDATALLVSMAQKHGDDVWMAAAILSSARESAADLIQGLLADGGFNDAARDLLRPLSATVAGEKDIAGVVALIKHAAERSSDEQNEILAGLLDGLPSDAVASAHDEWLFLTPLLRSKNASTRSQTVQLALKLGLREHSIIKTALASLATVAQNESESEQVRRNAIESLAGAPHAIIKSVAAQCQDARRSPSLQLAAIKMLGSGDSDQTGAMLIQPWRRYTPELRKAVKQEIFARPDRMPALVTALEDGIVKAFEISAGEQEQLLRSVHERKREEVRRLFIGQRIEDDMASRFEAYRVALNKERDVANGKKVFTQHCANCHKVGTEGYAVGPDLGTITAKPDATILTDILDPNATLDPQFLSYTVITRDGRSFAGLLASESATNVVLKKEKELTESILRRDIDHMEASEVSLMPANFHETIKPKDAADLLAFLRMTLTKD